MFQLVIQFAESAPNDLSRLVALEDQLLAIEALEGGLDGHDIGKGEMNLFLFTATPQAAFATCLPLVAASGLEFRGAGFRPQDGDAFERIWPQGSIEPFNVT